VADKTPSTYVVRTVDGNYHQIEGVGDIVIDDHGYLYLRAVDNDLLGTFAAPHWQSIVVVPKPADEYRRRESRRVANVLT
jgi:hypothetical protein